MIRQTTFLVALVLASGCAPSSPAVDPQATTSAQGQPVGADSTADSAASAAVAQQADGGQAMPAGDGAAGDDAQESSTTGLPLSAATCAADGYASFFERFVESADVREAYTAASIEIGTAGKPASAVKKSNYDDFRIGVVDSRWVYLDPAIKNAGELPLLDVDMKQDDGKTLRVDYKTADPEDGDGDAAVATAVHGTYTFRLQDNCWYLTSDQH